MSFAKILDINGNLMKTAAGSDTAGELSRQIEGKLASLDDLEGLPYGKDDIVQLISSIEEEKIRFVKAVISARQLYADITSKLSQFKIRHPRFDYLNDPAIDACHS